MEQSAPPAPDGEAVPPATSTSVPDRTKQPKPKKEKPPKAKKDNVDARPKPKPKAKGDNASKAAPTDPDAMFKQGFLADVYAERPEAKVVTRCMFGAS